MKVSEPRSMSNITADAIMDMAIPDPNSGCWIWAYATRKGYGAISIKRKIYSAHRLIYRLLNPLEDMEGKLVCHKCDVPECVNPEHLFLGTPEQNAQDCIKKGRHARGACIGSNKYNAILSEEDIPEIRRMLKRGEQGVDIAHKFNVRPHVISSIKRNKTWRHV